MNFKKIVILVPVYDDWSSFNVLLDEIDKQAPTTDIELTVVAVNDASIKDVELDKERIDKLKSISDIDVLHLNCNMGHQRALAIGLANLESKYEFDAVIIMDSDGEDEPADLPVLINEYKNNENSIIVARRDKRSEGILFRAGYTIYKILFRLLTGTKITFGNYCLVPKTLLKRLIYNESLWNHIAATILKTGLPLIFISTKRGKRYKGKPRMNLRSLILLGLSAVSVYAEIALLRILSTSIFFSALTILGIFIVFLIRLFTDLAIPGWASDVVGSLIIIFIQCIMVSVFVLFLMLSNRSHRMFIPARHYADYILKSEKIL